MKNSGVFAIIFALIIGMCGCSWIRLSGKTASASGVIITPQPTPVLDEQTATTVQTATAKPTATEAPVCKTVTVSYASSTVTIIGLDPTGATLWTNTINVKNETELQPYSQATIQNDTIYLQANYKMIALNGATGESLWASAEEGGFCKPIVRNGVVYTCSYYGEPLIGISIKDGATLFKTKMEDDTFYWADSLKFVDDTVVVHFGAAGSDQCEGTAVFGLNGKFISEDVGE